MDQATMAKPDPQELEALAQDLEPVTRDTGPMIALHLVENTDLQQKDIAQLLGWSAPTISRWIAEAKQKRENERNERKAQVQRRLLIAAWVLRVIITLALIVIAAASATSAWG